MVLNDLDEDGALEDKTVDAGWGGCGANCVPFQKFSLIFFHLECMQDTVFTGNNKLHVPNLCIAQEVCEKCYASEDIRCFSENCGQHIFEDLTCIEKFLDYVKKHRVSKVFCIAHNLKGYDGQFILKEMSNRNEPILPIMSGSKLIKLVYKNITFIDSLSFLPMSLAKFPKAFGLENVAKGYYPHFFNTQQNKYYVGCIPPIEYFGTESFDPKELMKFNIWHKRLVDENYIFNNIQELKKYCSMDVTLLRKGCLKFMDNFKQVNNLRQMGYNVVVKWECVFKLYLKENTSINKLLSSNYELNYNMINCIEMQFLGVERKFFVRFIKLGRQKKIAM